MSWTLNDGATQVPLNEIFLSFLIVLFNIKNIDKYGSLKQKLIRKLQ